MTTIAVPYHIDEHLGAFDVGLPGAQVVTADLPAGDPWARMAVLHEAVADAVAQAVAAGGAPPIVVSGDCTTSLGVLAGLQRAGHDPGIVWLDAHADFHTEATTTSGYLGGMPLALAVGLGTLTLPTALGPRPVAEERTVLVDARDTDPGEHVLLRASAVRRLTVSDLGADTLPDGPLYLHVDVDVADPVDAPDLRYPAPGGPPIDEITAAIDRVLATGRVMAIGLGTTWHHGTASASRHRDLVGRLLGRLDEG